MHLSISFNLYKSTNISKWRIYCRIEESVDARRGRYRISWAIYSNCYGYSRGSNRNRKSSLTHRQPESSRDCEMTWRTTTKRLWARSVWYTKRRAPTDVRVTYVLCGDTSNRVTKPGGRTWRIPELMVSIKREVRILNTNWYIVTSMTVIINK